jgi:hypothetical protein
MNHECHTVPAIQTPTGQRLVRLRAPAPNPNAMPRRHASSRAAVEPATRPSAELYAEWQAKAEAARQLRRTRHGQPTTAAETKALNELWEAGQTLMARIRQSFADAT